MGTATKVCSLPSIRAWSRLIANNKVSYRKLTLKFLVSFTLLRGSIGLSRTDKIQFQLFEALDCMNYTDFTFCMDPYDLEFTRT